MWGVSFKVGQLVKNNINGIKKNLNEEYVAIRTSLDQKDVELVLVLWLLRELIAVS